MNKRDNGTSIVMFILIITILTLLFLGALFMIIHSNTANAVTYDYDTPTIDIPIPTGTVDISNVENVQNVLSNTPCWLIKQELRTLNEKETIPEPEPERTEYFDLPLDQDLQDYIFELCEQYELDPRIVFAVIQQESRCTADIKGDSGRSFGLMQIQIKWHKDRMEKLGCTDLLDPYQNVAVGIDFIDELYTYGGRKRSTEWVLMAYNGGPGFANKKIAAGELSGYARSVLSIAKRLEVVTNAA